MIHTNTSPLMAAALLAALLLTGCTGAPSRDCPIAGQKAMTIVRLYFGRDIAGRDPVSDQEWAAFASSVLTPRFPDGFTTFEGHGQWLDPGSRQVLREASVVVEVAFDAGSDYAPRVDEVTTAYKQQFHQEAVGVITESGCGHF